MRRPVLAVLCFSAIVTMVGARQNSGGVGTWKNFTDMKSVRALRTNAGVLWAATGGGTFSYEMTDSAFGKFTNSEGLSSNELTAITIDEAGNVWTGASDGSINVFDGVWREVRDIAVSNRIQKSIKKFVQRGDSMFVVSDFGVSVYLISRKEFADTYSSFGFTSQALVNSVLLQANRIWVATNQGVATALLSSTNLTAPTSWTIYGFGQGLPSVNTTSFSLFYDTLVVGAVGGAAYFSGGNFQSIGALSNRAIVDLEQQGNTLYILWNSGNNYTVESMAQLNGPTQQVAAHSGTRGNDLLLSSTSPMFWVATSSRGVAQWNGGAWSYILPNGPQSNLFVGVEVDRDGVLWAGSGINAGGVGFYSYDPSLPKEIQWKNFTTAQHPMMGSDDYYKISIGSENSIWVSSWGKGVVEVVDDTIRRRLDVTSRPSLASSVLSDPSFVVIGSVALDGEGAAWFVNRTAINGNFLARLVNDTTFVYYRNLYNPSEGFFTNLVIDREGTKWLANSEPTVKNARGLYYFNEKGIVSGTENTGGWGFISTSEGLPNAVVMSLAADNDGDIWIGTDLGVMIVTDPRFPRTRRTSSFPLREQSIQSIAVDGLNNKWVGTREGVFAVNADGTQLLEHHTVVSTNGKLVSNDVRSIAIDQRRGVVYFGTERGLSSLQIAAVEPGKTYTSLELGPNPYLIPNEEQLVIRNLVINTTLKILTVNGLLVSQFKAQGGGRAFWDGKDARGQLVPTGIYFVVAFADNGDQITTGKVAVVRR